MALPLPYPGVQVQELPPAARAITGVSTSATAFVGRARRGAVDRATQCFSFADFGRLFGGLWSDSALSYAVHQYFLNGGREAIVVRLAPGALPASASVGGLVIEASSPGAWGNQLVVDVAAGATASTFHLTVRELDPADPAREVARERFLDVSVDPASARPVDRVLAQGSALARVRSMPTTSPPVGSSPAAGGTDGDSILPALAYDDPSDPLFRTNRRGLYALDAVETVNLLCLPPPGRATDQYPAVWTAAAAWCAERFTVLLVDPPSRWTSPTDAAARTTLEGLTTDRAAIWFPQLVAPDPLRDGRPASFAPCGAIAGVIARTDATRGIWKAPAGQDAGLLGVTGFATSLAQPTPAVSLTDNDCGVLNPAGINALRWLGAAGPVVWGARTARGADELASEWKYLPVRRLALHIEQSLVQGTRWAVFEPNDDALWGQLRLSIGAFLQQLFRRGAFKGERPSDAYFVKCDAETTLPADQDLGVVNVVVGFAPLKPAEFVVLQFQQITRTAS